MTHPSWWTWSTWSGEKVNNFHIIPPRFGEFLIFSRNSFFPIIPSCPKIFSDTELVQKTLENPDNYAPHNRSIWRTNFTLYRSYDRLFHEEIEELAQMVFIKSYRSINGFDVRLKFSSWLYRIAHNLCVDYLRKNSKHQQMSLDAEDEYSQALIETIASEDNVSLRLETDEQKKGIQKSLECFQKNIALLSSLFRGREELWRDKWYPPDTSQYGRDTSVVPKTIPRSESGASIFLSFSLWLAFAIK